MKNIRFQGEDPCTIEQHKLSVTISLEAKTPREILKQWDWLPKENIQFVSLVIFKLQWTNWDDWASFKQGVEIRELQRPLATSNILHLHDSIFANSMQVILSKSLY